MQVTKLPRISIITVVLNSVNTLLHCIESVKSQSLPSEYIIIDGGSTDGSLEIIDKYRSYFSQCVSEPDKGMYDAMNKGIALATGDVIGILNADDFYPHRHVLEKVEKVFTDHQVDSCYGDLDYVDVNNTKIVVRSWRSGLYHERRFYQGWMPPHPTFFVRREGYKSYGAFNLAMGSASDYELMLRFLVKHKIKTHYIPEVLVNMRSGGISNRSLKSRIAANRMDRLAWKINGLRPYPWTLIMKPLSKIHQFFV